MLQAKDLQTLGFHVTEDIHPSALLGNPPALDVTRAEALRGILSDYAADRYGEKHTVRDGTKVCHNAEDVLEVVYPLLQDKDREECWALFMLSDGTIGGRMCFGTGDPHQTGVSATQIIRNALLADCEGVILVHNHPRNNPKPSQNDINFTKKVKDMLNVFGMSLRDHIIIGRKGYYSFETSQDMPFPSKKEEENAIIINSNTNDHVRH